MAALWGWGDGLCCCACGVVVVAAVRYWRHPRRPVTVNCHFCNSDTKVPQEQMNSFTCPGCGQYNGFTADGDYNRPLDQSASSCGFKRYTRGSPPSGRRGTNSPPTNGLCRSCNLNQELKVSQLASCGSEGDELDRYIAHLERVYRLCPECEESLSVRLTAQDSRLAPTLLAYRLEQSRCNNSSSTPGSQDQPGRRLAGRLPLVAALGLWLAIIWPLLTPALQLILPEEATDVIQPRPISVLPAPSLLLSLLLPVLAILLPPPHSRVSVGLFCLLPCLSLGLQLWVQLVICSCVCLLLAHLPATAASAARINQNGASPPPRDPYSTQFLAALNASVNGNGTRKEVEEEVREEPGQLQRSSSSSSLFSSSLRLNTKSSPLAGRQQQQQVVAPPRLSSPLLRSGPEDSFNHEFAIQDTSGGGGGRDCDISSLSLADGDEDDDEDRRPRRSVTASPPPPNIFLPRLYSPENSTATGIRFTARPPLLRPSRLTSWVAGGYWGSSTSAAATTALDTPKLGAAASPSRASSQSSGFASASVPSLNLPPTTYLPPQQFASLPNSIAGGTRSVMCADRYSVLSEPILLPSSSSRHLLQRSPSALSRQSDTVHRTGDTPRSRRAFRRATQDEDLSDSESSLQPRGKSSPVNMSDPARRWSKTISFELTLERVLMACSMALNMAVVGYYFCSAT